MEIITFGSGERLMRAAGRLSTFCSACGYSRVILLPVPSSRDKKHITSTDMPLSEILFSVRAGTLVAGYALPRELCDAVSALGGNFIDLSENEDFLTENADVTAHGTLGHILSNFSEDIADMRIGVIGYGRIGRSLTRLLLFLGADVRVYTTRETVARELCEAGVSAETVGDGVEWEKNELLINTAPAKLISEKRLAELSSVNIIDLASGKIFPDLPNVTKLASVPDAMYPETAGRIYAKYVKKALLLEGGV